MRHAFVRNKFGLHRRSLEVNESALIADLIAVIRCREHSNQLAISFDLIWSSSSQIRISRTGVKSVFLNVPHSPHP